VIYIYYENILNLNVVISVTKLICVYVCSVTALRSAEMIEKFEIAKLNIVINNISTIQNYYNEDYNYILQDGLDLTK